MADVRHPLRELDDTERRIAAALLLAPRATWRTLARVLGLSERTVVRRAVPLYGSRTLRATAVRSPARFPGLIPLVLRIRCRPGRVRAVAAALARRPDTTWVDILGGGDEISAIVFLDGPDARDRLLLRDLPATAAVDSWTAHSLLHVFPAAFTWHAGLLSAPEAAELHAVPDDPAPPPAPLDTDPALIGALAEDARSPYTALAGRAGVSPLTARRRLDALVQGHVVRLATEVDVALLGIRAETLLWLSVAPGNLPAAGRTLSRHPCVRFAAAVTGRADLLVAVATDGPGGLYGFLTGTLAALDGVVSVETTPLLATVKRTGLTRSRMPAA